MIECEALSSVDLQPGTERRTMMRRMGLRIGREDFTDAEWVQIEVEAPGMAADLWAMLETPNR